MRKHEIDIEFLKQLIEALFGYQCTEADEVLLMLSIRSRIDFVLSYCNRNDLPKRLKSQLYYMIVGEFLYRKIAVLGVEGLGIEIDPLVSSIKEGDTTVNFSVSSDQSPEAVFKSYVNQLRNGDHLTLQEYRRLKW